MNNQTPVGNRKNSGPLLLPSTVFRRYLHTLSSGNITYAQSWGSWYLTLMACQRQSQNKICAYTLTSNIISTALTELHSSKKTKGLQKNKYLGECMIDGKHWVQVINEHQSTFYRQQIKLSMWRKQLNDQNIRDDNIFIWLVVWNIKITILLYAIGDRHWGLFIFLIKSFTVHTVQFLIKHTISP